PEDLSSGPRTAVLRVGRRVEMSSRSAKAGVDGSTPDAGPAEDVDAVPLDALIDAADGARGSRREPRQVHWPVKPRPGVRRANRPCPDQREGREQRTSASRRPPGHAPNYTT